MKLAPASFASRSVTARMRSRTSFFSESFKIYDAMVSVVGKMVRIEITGIEHSGFIQILTRFQVVVSVFIYHF